MGKEVAIHVENVSKSYGKFKAVDDVTFEVYGGEIFAMLGPNGAGKSTTIRMILDIMKPDAGRIAVFGQTLNDQLKDRIGYLPEERGLYREVKVIDMMVYLATLKGMSSSAARKRAMELLTQLELDDKATSKVKEFSKGMQQKVQFAVTILHDPDLIIIDEPFSGLDPINTLAIKNMLIELKNKGAAVVMSTHQMYQVEEMADRLMMINHGQQALYGTVDEVRERYASHAVIVSGEGDWASLPEVVRVEDHHNARDAKKLFLRENSSTNDLLASIAAAPGIWVDLFERAVPSLNEIFIQVAGEDPEVSQVNVDREERVVNA